MKICPRCGAYYPEEFQVCPQCQTHLPPAANTTKSPGPIKGILLTAGVVLAAALLIFAALTARHIICLRHDFSPATCTKAKVCKLCEKTEGSSLGHDWLDATCTDPQTCGRCGKTRASALGHQWADASCTQSKTCQTCALTEGAPLGHNWKASSCTEDQVCLTCSAVGEPAAGHISGDWVTSKEPTLMESGQNTRSCQVCGEILETLPTDKKEPVINDYNFNFKDEEFIAYVNSFDEVMISPTPIDASEFISDPSILVYRAYLGSYDSTLLMIYHDADGYINGYYVAGSDKGLVSVVSLVIAGSIDADVDLDLAVADIVEYGLYATDALAVIPVTFDESVYASFVAPLPYVLEILES